MNAKWYAVLVGLVALIGLCFWRSSVSPTRSLPEAVRESSKETQPTEATSVARETQTAPASTDRFWGRLEVDLIFLLAEPDAIRRDEKLQVVIDSIAFNEIPAALQFFQRQEQTQFLQDLQVLLIRKGAATDPQAAAKWVEQILAGSTRSASFAGVGVVWANQDLPAAARWALELAEGEDREVGLSSVAFEAARTRPSFALELTANLAPNDARDELIRHATRQWAAQNPKEAVAWAADLANPTLREQLLADIAAAWGETDPRAAAELALQSLSSGKPQEDALVGIAQQWVQKEPERAAAWVFEFPESFQPTALENVVKIWANSDAPQATKWAENLPSGFLRDTALSVLAAK